jgi:hypothetical protein
VIDGNRQLVRPASSGTSGPLLTRWLYSASSESEGAFLEFMGAGVRRSLTVKCSAGAEGQVAALQARIADSLVDSGSETAT